MSFQEPRRRNRGAGLGILILIVFGLGFYILYTDEIQGTIDAAQSVNAIKGFTDLLPLNLANISVDGDIICDLDLQIPTMVSNRAFFGSTNADVISDAKIPFAEFLDEPQWYYIGNENQNMPTFEWLNCYEEGKLSLSSVIPLFSGQLASEKLSLLSFDDGTRQFTSLDPSAAGLGPLTESTKITLSISGKNPDGLFLVDKFNKANFVRSVNVPDGLAYPIADNIRFTIENVKLDDYKISVISVKPINEMVIGEPFTFNIPHHTLREKTQANFFFNMF